MRPSRAEKTEPVRREVLEEEQPELQSEGSPHEHLRGLQPLVGNRALLAMLSHAAEGLENTADMASALPRRIETREIAGDEQLSVNGTPLLRYSRAHEDADTMAARWSNRSPNHIRLAVSRAMLLSARLNVEGWNRLAGQGLTVVPQAASLPSQAGQPTRVEVGSHAEDAGPAVDSERIVSSPRSGEGSSPPPPAIVEPPPDGNPQPKCACGGTCSKCAGSGTIGNTATEREADQVATDILCTPRAHVIRALPAGPTAAPDFGPGAPLPRSVREFFEPRFGLRFNSVQVHTGAQAEAASERMGARAFAFGSSLVFNRSEYSPESEEGRSLLAHELTHVVQQRKPGAEARVQKQEKPGQTPAGGGVLAVTIYRSDDPLQPSYIVFKTAQKSYTYVLHECTIPAGSYETEVHVKDANVEWIFSGGVTKSQQYGFNYDVEKGQQNPATLLRDQKTVQIEVKNEKLVALPAVPEKDEDKASLPDRVARFKGLVKAAGQVRLANNRSALADWRVFLEKKLTSVQVERGAYAQGVRDLQVLAVHEGGRSLQAYDEAVSSANPLRREKAEGQVRGRYRACTGCHLENLAQQYEKEYPHEGRQWIAPVTVLKRYAGEESINPTPKPDFFRKLPGEGLSKEAEIHDPQLPGASAASAAIASIQPFLQILGPAYYAVLPDDLLVSHALPADVMGYIITHIEGRRSAYASFSAKIGEPDFDYLKLRPIVRDLLPLQEEDVQQSIEVEIKTAEAWATVEKVLMAGVAIGLLLLAIFPPTSAIGIAGVAALETGAAAFAIYSGVESIEEGYLLSKGKGAHDVLDPEQQEAAGLMMVMGALNVVLGVLGLKAGVAKGLKVLRAAPAVEGATATAARVVDGLEAEAGGNKIVISDIASGNPKVKVTSPDGKVLYDGPLKDMPQGGFGAAETAPAVRPDSATFARQRAAAAEELAASKEAQALELESRAAKVKAPDKAAKFKADADALRKQAAALREDAAAYASGTKSATHDLPTPDEIGAEIDKLAAGQGAKPQQVEVPLGNAERTPADLPRLTRGLLKTPRGRVVFRVEGGGSRTLLKVDPSGAITTTPGTAYLNFGSLERALEFLAKRGPGSRIVAFEVEEAWVDSVRSAAIPEQGTSFLSGKTPKLVDVRFAADQLEIPANLLPEMEKFIVPGSAKVILAQ